MKLRRMSLSLFVKWSLFLSLMASAVIALPKFETTPTGQRVVAQTDSVLLENLETLSILGGVIAIALNWPQRRREQLKGQRYDAWQVIFAAKGERICDLRTQALESLNKDRMDLSELPLEGAKLRGVKLDKAQLEGVRLADADLVNGQLSGANLTHGRLRRANLANVKLTGAILTSSDLSYADLSQANLRSANLREANLAGARLEGTCLKFSDCRDVQLHNADLEGASLVGANLTDADMTGAELRNANLKNANLSHAILAGANFARANLQGIRWQDDEAWRGVTGLDSARNVPAKLKQYLKASCVDGSEVGIFQG